MKQIIKSVLLIGALVASFGCQKEIEPAQKNRDGQYEYRFVVRDIETKADPTTKAEIGDNCIEWVSGDQVGIFIGDTPNYARMDVSKDPVMAILYSTTAIPVGTMAYAYAPKEDSNTDKTNARITLSAIQNGASTSAMPLVGVPFEVEEVIDPRAQEGNGAIQFLNLGSLVNFKIFSSNTAYQNEVVSSVKFEATKTIAGSAYIDLTSVDAADENTLELSFNDPEDEKDFVRVDQELPVAATKADATPIKMVILPGSFMGTLTVTTDVATYTIAMPEREYVRGHVRTWNLDLNVANRVEGVDEVVKTLPYEETFTTNQGDFKIDNVALPNGQNTIWTFDASYGAKVTAYIDNTNYAAESWLISPWIDLTDVSAAAVSFDHVSRYGTNATDFTFWVLSDQQNAEWVKQDIPTYSPGNNWDFVNSGEIFLDAFVGSKVKVAFRYLSTTSQAGTWEIKNFSAHLAKATPDLSYERQNWEIDLTDETPEAQELTNPHELSVTYSSSNADVVSIDAESGEITLGGITGYSTITATFAGNEVYYSGTASYTIVVSDTRSVTLPWRYPEEGESVTSAGLIAIPGVSASGLGSDYAESNKPYRIKFDTTGDYIQVKTNTEIATVSISYKLFGSSSSKFTIKESADGTTWEEVEVLTTASSQNTTGTLTTSSTFDSNSRYIQIYFTKGGNVGVGGISITKPNTDPIIFASDISDVPASGVTNEDNTYSVSNFEDDVEVASVSGCVTEAIASEGAIVYSVGPNYADSAQEGTIVLWSAANHSIVKTINVLQLKSTLTVSTTTVTIPASSSTASFTVTSKEFSYSAIVASTETGMNLSISGGETGSASASAQTVTVSSTTNAPLSGDPIELGRIKVFRNGNDSDPQLKEIVIKKAVDTGSNPHYVKVSKYTSGKTYLIVSQGYVLAHPGTSAGTVSGIPVSINNDSIAQTDDVKACEFVISNVTIGSNTIQVLTFSNSGSTIYVTGASGKTSLGRSTSAPNSTSAYTAWAVTTTTSYGSFVITNKGTNNTSRAIRFRGSSYKCFGNYSAVANGTEYYNVDLYELTD